MQKKLTPEQVKQAKKFNRCKQCGLAARDHPSRHMKTWHKDLEDEPF